MVLLLVPVAVLGIAALLALASALETRSPIVAVRLSLRSAASPDLTEELVAAELEPLLVRYGLTDRPPTRGRDAGALTPAR